MPHILERREVGREYDADYRNLIITEEVVWGRWDHVGERRTKTEKKSVPLTDGEREYLLSRA